ncbi:hypothetical protein M3221_00475 [Domibacillus indicus]|uniref:hypothetical protein n=1 Tax=Domibacillus indicus TaxID=1437523 RepID=UPI002040E5C9|nr:hypothetical protein [Domibacillus indicus]MCM3786905.1 hypothetical protein [Domibacillus indicus]
MSKKKKAAAPKSIHDVMAKKAARPKLSETHTRRTFHVENKLLPIIDQLEATAPARGFKKELINVALRRVLREDYGIDV